VPLFEKLMSLAERAARRRERHHAAGAILKMFGRAAARPKLRIVNRKP
jgi:hypothetical protein